MFTSRRTNLGPLTYTTTAMGAAIFGAVASSSII